MVPVVQIRIIGIVRSVEEGVCISFGFLVAFQVGSVVHGKAVEGGMAGIRSQTFLSNLQGFLKIMVQEQGESIFQPVVFRSHGGVDKLGIGFGCFPKAVVGIIHFGQFLVGFHAVGGYRFKLLQLLYGLRGTGRFVGLRILQITFAVIGVEIDGLLIKLTSLAHVFPGKGYVTFEYRDRRSFVIGLLCQFQVVLGFRQFACIQVGTGNGGHKIHILFILAFQQCIGFIEGLFGTRLYQTFHFIHTRLPFGHRRLCGERTCQQQRSHTEYKFVFHFSFHFSYSSLTFTTRTGWVAGSNPDFSIIRCPRSEARKEANPQGSAPRGSFSRA